MQGDGSNEAATTGGGTAPIVAHAPEVIIPGSITAAMRDASPTPLTPEEEAAYWDGVETDDGAELMDVEGEDPLLLGEGPENPAAILATPSTAEVMIVDSSPEAAPTTEELSNKPDEVSIDPAEAKMEGFTWSEEYVTVKVKRRVVERNGKIIHESGWENVERIEEVRRVEPQKAIEEAPGPGPSPPSSGATSEGTKPAVPSAGLLRRPHSRVPVEPTSMDQPETMEINETERDDETSAEELRQQLLDAAERRRLANENRERPAEKSPEKTKRPSATIRPNATVTSADQVPALDPRFIPIQVSNLEERNDWDDSDDDVIVLTGYESISNSSTDSKKRRRRKNKKDRGPRQWTLDDYVSPTSVAHEEARGTGSDARTSTGTIPKRPKSPPERERSRTRSTGREAPRTSTPIPTSAPQLHTTGIMFGGLAPVPHDPELDPPARCCFRCWSNQHPWPRCPQPGQWQFCKNCGRRGLTISSCPRCSEIHHRQMEERYGPRPRQPAEWRPARSPSRSRQHEDSSRRTPTERAYDGTRDNYRGRWNDDERRRSPSRERRSQRDSWGHAARASAYERDDETTDRDWSSTRRAEERRRSPSARNDGYRGPAPSTSHHRETSSGRARQSARERLGPTPLDTAQRDREETLLEFMRQVEGLPFELRVRAVQEFFGTEPAAEEKRWPR